MELSTMELVAIALIAFLVLGPEEMLRQSRRLGKFVAKMKSQANNFRIMVESEVDWKTLEGKSSQKTTPLAPMVSDHDLIVEEPLVKPSSDGEGQGGT